MATPLIEVEAERAEPARRPAQSCLSGLFGCLRMLDLQESKTRNRGV